MLTNADSKTNAKAMHALCCGRFTLEVGAQARPLVMGILNLTPDSFSDGGAFIALPQALAQAQKLRDEGADILDIGAESTRPGATKLSHGQEWARLAPVLNELVKWQVPVSVDTYKAATMRKAIDAGCDMINCVAGFRDEGAVDAVAKSSVALCVMHMQGEPQTMQRDPQYADVVHEVRDFLQTRAQVLQAAGVSPDRIVLDPGYGFGKTTEHNLSLLKHQSDLLSLGFPLLAGLSRKGILGLITKRPADKRLAASLAAALFAAEQGARILRVHDVAETGDVLNVWRACESGKIQTV
jgi:dihydropteroate synthase